MCFEKAYTGEVCWRNQDCRDNNCLNNVCAPAPSPTPYCRMSGSACNASGQCCAGSYCDYTSSTCLASLCVPWSSSCFIDDNVRNPIMKICSRNGAAYTYSTCADDYKCTRDGTTCIPSSMRQYYDSCTQNSDCLSGNCGRDYALSDGLICLPQYVCSSDQSQALAVNINGSVQWNQSLHCEAGCDPTTNECRNNSTLICNSTNEGKHSYDQKEVCLNGNWRCVEGSLRQMINAPYLDPYNSQFEKCVNGTWYWDFPYSNLYYNQFYCKNNGIWKKQTGGDQLFRSCASDTYCVETQQPYRADCVTAPVAENILGCHLGDVIFTLDTLTQYCGQPKVALTIFDKLPETDLSYAQYLALHNQATCVKPGQEVFKGNIRWSDGTVRDCRLLCNNDGQVQDEYCSASLPKNLSELKCGPDGNVYLNLGSAQNQELVETCSLGCSIGACIKPMNSQCGTEGEIVPFGNSQYLICRDGKYQPYAHGAYISWLDCPNSYVYTSLKNVANVADYLFPLSNAPTVKCLYVDSTFGGLAGSIISDNLLTLACGDPNSDFCKEVFTHELSHEQAFAQKTSQDNFFENTHFNSVTGCTKSSVTNTYSFPKEKPVSSYGYTNCIESLAESSTAYTNKHTEISACEMKRNEPCQYKFFRDDPSSFYNQGGEHKEFCADQSIPLNCTNPPVQTKMFSAYAQANPQDQYPLISSLIVGTKLADSTKLLVTKTTSSATETYYDFTSLSSSHPHTVRVDASGTINYLSLVLPATAQASAASELKLFGTPEVLLGNSRAEMINAFPSRGVAYIVNEYANAVVETWHFTPTTIEIFKQTFGQNYAEIPLPGQELLPDVDVDGDVDYLDLIHPPADADLTQQYNRTVSMYGHQR
jgi:hypothetical protein